MRLDCLRPASLGESGLWRPPMRPQVRGRGGPAPAATRAWCMSCLSVSPRARDRLRSCIRRTAPRRLSTRESAFSLLTLLTGRSNRTCRYVQRSSASLALRGARRRRAARCTSRPSAPRTHDATSHMLIPSMGDSFPHHSTYHTQGPPLVGTVLRSNTFKLTSVRLSVSDSTDFTSPLPRRVTHETRYKLLAPQYNKPSRSDKHSLIEKHTGAIDLTAMNHTQLSHEYSTLKLTSSHRTVEVEPS